MFRAGVVTLFPQMFCAIAEHGVTRKAIECGLLKLDTFNPRDYTTDHYRSVDDRPYGGGPGMVMMAGPVRAAIRVAKQALPDAGVIYMSPQGRPMKQQDVIAFAERDALIFLAGRYEGIDERVIEQDVDEQWSVGDYVLSGGELPAMIMIDAITRCIPGVLGNAGSALADSFYYGMLDYPHYTRPENADGQGVPAVLLSGHHEAIRKWRLQQALGRTWKHRPDLLEALTLNKEQQMLLDEYMNAHRR